MKRRIQWMAAVLLAGSAAMAIGGPNIGPYGPWNSGGAYGGFGPYDPYVARGYHVQEGLPPVAEVVSNDCAIPSRRVMVSESLPIVGERLSSCSNLAMTDQTVPIMSRANCIGGREFITTTSRIRPVNVQRTFVVNGDLAPVGERVVTFRPAFRERLLPVGERLITTSSFSDNCDLAPVAERRLLPIRERRLLPVRERLVETSTSFRPFNSCDLAPVAERRGFWPFLGSRRQPIVINTEVITTTTRWNTGGGSKKHLSHHAGKKLESVAEKSCALKKHHLTKTSKKQIMPVGEKVLIHKKGMIKKASPLYPSAGNKYVNPYR